MADDRKAVMTEMEELNLEEMRFKIGKLRSNSQLRKVRAMSVERSLKADMQRETTIQANCWHKKGGKGVEMMYRGNDANYAVIKNILPHGVLQVFCQRCGKVWEPPPASLNARGASIENRRLYKLLYEEYQKAVNFPTDNETSGSQLFMLTTGAPSLPSGAQTIEASL
jgi:hypothetical protein